MAETNEQGLFDAAFAVPGDIEAATGGYAYARKVLKFLPECGVNGHLLALPGSFPNPTSQDLALTRQLIDQIHPSTPILFDGLAFGAMPSETLVGIKAPIVALVHHPLALETGLSDRRRDELLKSERDALSRADAIIVSSPLTARTLVSDYGVAADRVTIAEPGTEPAIRSRGTGMPFTMLAVGALIPRKGYPILIDGLKELGREDWQLTIVGSPDHDPLESNRIRERVLSSGLRSRVKIAGKVSAKDLQRLFAHADLFVMPSLYEGYGMVLAEAMAHGLPIVCTTGGAAAETAPDEAAIKVSPGDAEAFSEAIARVMGDKALCDAMSEAAWEAGRRLPRWSTSVAKIAKVLKNVKKKENA